MACILVAAADAANAGSAIPRSINSETSKQASNRSLTPHTHQSESETLLASVLPALHPQLPTETSPAGLSGSIDRQSQRVGGTGTFAEAVGHGGAGMHHRLANRGSFSEGGWGSPCPVPCTPHFGETVNTTMS